MVDQMALVVTVVRCPVLCCSWYNS